MTSKVDLLVLGATGVTGRQTTRYLAAHPERSTFTLAIAGRSQKKLDALVAEYSLDSSIQIFTVDVTNFEQVEELVQKVKVVLNTVGPYYRWGTPVVRACARNGVHYVDLTGESFWVKEIIQKYDYCASKTGAIIVPACGIDSIPSDISVYVANKALKEASADKSSPLQIESSTTAWKISGVLSYGSFSTVITSMELVPRVQRRESRQPYCLSPVIGRPTARPRLLYSMFVPSIARTFVGGIWFMQPSNKAIVERSWGLLEYDAITSKSKDAEKARYGPRMIYDEFYRTKNTFGASVLSLGLVLTMTLMLIRPIRWIFKKIGPQEGSGPTDATLDKGKMTTVNVTRAESSNTQVVVTIEGKGDPGYLLSPIFMADGALTLLNSPSLSPLAQQGGVLTPATAFGDAFVQRMHKNPRLDLRVEIVKDGNVETRKNI